MQKQQVGAQLSRVDLATFAAAQQQMAGVGGALPASSISNVLGSSATSPNSTNLNNVGAGQQTSTFSSSQATNPQNGIAVTASMVHLSTKSLTPHSSILIVQFIHKLLRLPFSQVPELHRTLYLQLRQRLQSRGAPNATGNMAQMTQAQLQNINLATLLGTNSPGQAAGSQPAQTAPIQMQRQQLLAQAQAVRQQQLQQQAFIAAQGATGQLGNQTTSAGTQQFTAAQLNAIQQQLVQQQLMASNSNVNAAGLSNIMNMGAVRSSQPGQGGAAGSLADQQQPAVTTLLLQQQQQAAAAAKQQLQRDTKSPSPARRPK